jgi:hypothetical protein
LGGIEGAASPAILSDFGLRSRVPAHLPKRHGEAMVATFIDRGAPFAPHPDAASYRVEALPPVIARNAI